jgi:hypothetical protein
MNIRRLTRTPDSYCSSHPGDRKEPGVTRACQSEPWGGDGIDARPDWFRRPCRGSTNSSPRTPGSLRSPGATVRGPSGAGFGGDHLAALVYRHLRRLFRLSCASVHDAARGDNSRLSLAFACRLDLPTAGTARNTSSTDHANVNQEIAHAACPPEGGRKIAPGDRREPGVSRASQSEPRRGDGRDVRPDWFRRPCRGSTNSSPCTPGSLRSPGATVRGPSGAGLDGTQAPAPVYRCLTLLFRLSCASVPGVTGVCLSGPWRGDGRDVRPDWFRRPCRGSGSFASSNPGFPSVTRGYSPPPLRGRVGWQSGRGTGPWASHALVSIASARLSSAPPGPGWMAIRSRRRSMGLSCRHFTCLCTSLRGPSGAGLDRNREPRHCAYRLPPGGGPENSPG